MSTTYIHISWFLSYLLVSMIALMLSYYSIIEGVTFFVGVSVFPFNCMDMQLSFYFNGMSLSFISVILMVTMTVTMFSMFYMHPYSDCKLFLVLIFLFVASMIVVVSTTSIFFLMLGWDGLGLVSFLLILFYQNMSSISAGILTVLLNRVGDCLMLVAMVMYYGVMGDFFMFSGFISEGVGCLFVLSLAFMTKTAIFPFSSWLPAAMAAPTPISALVHSSTLVTAGLFLFLRFSYVMYSNEVLMSVVLVLGLFTSFYAGIATVFEQDLKKVVAFSTLSHLGFILMAFSLGLANLAFFHLLSHALFKSMLFMGLGSMMVNSVHSQDSRAIKSVFLKSPFSAMLVLPSIFNLLAIPTMSGCYSKDLILEAFSYSNASLLAYMILMCNVGFTFIYTIKLFLSCINLNNTSPLNNKETSNLSSLFTVFLMMSLLSVVSIFFGLGFTSLMGPMLEELIPSIFWKTFPILILVSYIFMIVFFVSPFYYSWEVGKIGGSMFLLGVVSSSVVNSFLLKGLMATSSINNNVLSSTFQSMLKESVMSIPFYTSIKLKSELVLVLTAIGGVLILIL